MRVKKIIDRVGLVLQLIGSLLLILKVVSRLPQAWDQPWVLLIAILMMFGGRVFSGLFLYLSQLLNKK